jgi:hypothetical protein
MGTYRNMTEREGEELPVEDGGGDPVKTQPASVLTGRTTEELAEEASAR